MTDTKLLCDTIKNSGVTYSFIAEKIGMTRQGLFNKLNDKKSTDFRAWQMLVIVDILHLDEEMSRKIFFKQNVD